MKLTIVLVVLALFAVSCADEKSATPHQPAQRGTNVRPAVEAIASPAGAGAAEPFLFATNDGVLLSWLEPVAGTDRTALRFARYRAGRWSEPRTIVERNDLFVNWADFPSLVEDAQGTLFAHWLQKSGKSTYAYDVRMSISPDGGATWREPFLLNRDGKQREHGFATLAALPSGGVGATWLDGRNMKAGGEHEEDS
ncbi:MAG TPA: sialidase family protein, partial [Thermoanaerobaculia bacterium]